MALPDHLRDSCSQKINRYHRRTDGKILAKPTAKSVARSRRALETAAGGQGGETRPGKLRPANSEKGFVLVDLIINYFLSAISVMAPASFQVLSVEKKLNFETKYLHRIPGDVG